MALPNKLVPSVLKSEENWAIDAISKKTFSILLQFQNGLQWIVWESIPLIEKYPKKIPPTLGGGARQYSYQQFFRGKLKVQGLPPHLIYIYIYIFFIIFSISGLLLRTSWSHPFWNLRKIERLTRFQKKLPHPPLFSDFRLLLWKTKIAQFFSDYEKEGIKLFRRAIPL